MKIGFIGAGKMASAIIKGLKAGNFDIYLSEHTLEKSKAQAKLLAVNYADNHQALVDQVDLVVIAVKPQMLEVALKKVTMTKPVLSIVAGVTLERLAQLTHSDLPIIRIMPNLNAQILKSTTAICRNSLVSDALFDKALSITNTFGTSFVLDEKDFDTFTALAGSSPAYIALFIEALAKAGVKHGFPKDKALAIVTETLLATSENLLEGADSPHDFIDKVSSPGGTTIAGVLDLEKTGFTASTVSAIDATIARSKQL